MERSVCIILIHLFFISFIINLFVVFYSVYSLADTILFHNMQGTILKMKEKSLETRR
mgnify:CR=1 FL=1